MLPSHKPKWTVLQLHLSSHGSICIRRTRPDLGLLVWSLRNFFYTACLVRRNDDHALASNCLVIACRPVFQDVEETGSKWRRRLLLLMDGVLRAFRPVSPDYSASVLPVMCFALLCCRSPLYQSVRLWTKIFSDCPSRFAQKAIYCAWPDELWKRKNHFNCSTQITHKSANKNTTKAQLC